jgi:AcrR family transcriptional regulator
MHVAKQPPPQRLALDPNRMPARPAAHRRKPAAPRMNSESYFQAAFEILAESGAEGVTATNMCDRLGVTKGSFYYHFYSMPEFIEAFAQFWEFGWQTLMADFGREAGPLRRMGLVLTTTANMSHEAEAALRAWGHSNPVIAEAQRRIGQAAEDLTAAMIAPFVPADRRAMHIDQILGFAVGVAHRQRPVDRTMYARTMVNLIELICPQLTATVIESPEGPVVEFTQSGTAVSP